MWPDWLREAVPGGYDKWEVERKTEPIAGGDPITRRFKTVPYREKINCVCKDCNNNWMSDLETDASAHLKPLIQGSTGAATWNDRRKT